MNENKTFKQQLKDWWQDNRRVIKTGITFGILGIAYGFIKGVTTTDKMWFDHGFGRVEDYSGDSDSMHELTDENCDDSDLLAEVKSENENA